MVCLEAEFNPAKIIKDNIGSIEINALTDTPPKCRTDNNFSNWFERVSSTLGDDIHLILDTNFLRRHYYTNYLKKAVPTDVATKYTLMIPRLVILEIEGKYNRDPKKKLGKSCCPQDYHIGKERRIAFETIKEVLGIKSNGGDVIPNVDISLIESFSRASGMDHADHWIRREVRDYMKIHGGIRMHNTSIKVEKEIIFLTCDIMNALVAVAEGIPTIYFFRIKSNTEMTIGENSVSKFVTLVINTAILLCECECTIIFNEIREEFRLVGMWSGKSMTDWQGDHI